MRIEANLIGKWPAGKVNDLASILPQLGAERS